ncbi:MAG: PLDc N-terminal domain-containing protein [Bacteroidota bacterium]|nr:PLDc N-terminal domain-containing protein [Bacteroidota bacterium]
MTLLGIIAAQELIVILMVAAFIFLIPIIALVDIVRSKFEGNMQLIWVIIVVCLNLLGAILYFIVGRNQKIQQ